MFTDRLTSVQLHTPIAAKAMQKITIRLLQSVKPRNIPVLTAKDIQLTRQEIDAVVNSAFLSKIQPVKPRDWGNIPTSVRNATEYVQFHEGLLQPRRKRFAASPFEVYSKTKDDPHSNRVPIAQFPRLSVTKMLTKSWCELREMFKVYSQISQPSTSHMIAGNLIHSQLEAMTHKPLQLDLIPTVVVTPADHEANRLLEQILKIMDLFIHGEAREIYYNAFIDNDTGMTSDPRQTNLLLTGIIDHLTLEDDNGRVVRFLRDDIEDMDEFILLANRVPFDQLTLGVYDVKTRQSETLPGQKSVLEASKDQVRLYCGLISSSDSCETSLKLLGEYLKRKSFNIDIPLSQEFIKAAQTAVPIIAKDIEKQPTLRTLINRLSQLHSLINRPFQKQLGIEYYHQLNRFQTIYFDQNIDKTQAIIKSAMEYWSGNREAEPISQTPENHESKCKYCEFKRYCAWSNGMVENYVDRRLAIEST